MVLSARRRGLSPRGHTSRTRESLDSPASFVRRSLWGGSAMACAACLVLAALGMGGWAGGVAVGAGVALGNFWLLGRAVLRMGARVAGDGGGEAGAERTVRPGLLRATLQGTALRLVLAAAALGLTIAFLPINPLGVAAGLVGVHAGMAVLWLAGGQAGNGSEGA